MIIETIYSNLGNRLNSIDTNNNKSIKGFFKKNFNMMNKVYQREVARKYKDKILERKYMIRGDNLVTYKLFVDNESAQTHMNEKVSIRYRKIVEETGIVIEVKNHVGEEKETILREIFGRE